SGNLPQRLCGLPVWLAGYSFPSFDDPAWLELREWPISDQFTDRPGPEIDRMLLAGRSMTAVLGVALGLMTYAWSRALFGRWAGLLSLTLYVFSPTTLTHGFLITADMAAATFFVAAVGALWLLFHRVSPLTLIAAWLTLSGVFLSKFTGPIIVP